MSAVHFERKGPVAELRLDNPGKLNALTPGMLDSLARHVAEIEADAGIRAVVLSAEPARAFCAGADVTAWADLSPMEFARLWVREGHRVFDRLARMARPLVAALGGPAFGGGLELAATADIRVLAPDATIALPEAGIGIVPGWSGTQRLVRLIGEGPVREIALFGRRLPAERALALGFAAEIDADPRARALEIAEAAAALGPCAAEVAKYMINAAVGEDRASMIEALGSGMAAATRDRDEGVAAFREKRKPEFEGR